MLHIKKSKPNGKKSRCIGARMEPIGNHEGHLKFCGWPQCMGIQELYDPLGKYYVSFDSHLPATDSNRGCAADLTGCSWDHRSRARFSSQCVYVRYAEQFVCGHANNINETPCRERPNTGFESLASAVRSSKMATTITQIIDSYYLFFCRAMHKCLKTLIS